jgi:hypothetical protein
MRAGITVKELLQDLLGCAPLLVISTPKKSSISNKNNEIEKIIEEKSVNFFNALKKIVPIAAQIEHFAVPVAAGLYPPAAPILMQIDGMVNRVQTTMMTIEKQAPESVAGLDKQTATITDFNAYIQDLKSSLGLAGKTVQYDQEELKLAITSQHDAYTHFAKVKDSIKVV